MKHYRSICFLLVASIVAIVAEPLYENTFCMQRRCPYEGYVRCKSNARCIHTRYVCDGENDCLDGSDEENCGPAYYGCRGFLCDNRTRCISRRSVCDGNTSCSDGSDEADCLTGRCPFDSEVKCTGTGECYTAADICDGYYHCRYGNDEENCESRPCPYDSDFRCGDGACLRSRHVCSGYENCRDGSDEINCTSRCPYDGDVEYHYVYHSFPFSQCYRSYEYCDYKTYDYYYHHARFIFMNVTTPNCSIVPCPYEGDYRCPLSGVCIRSYEVCDGNYQCVIDHADEENCTSCGNSIQINEHIVICNGINDCADGSDESDCSLRICSVPGDIKCRDNGSCIHYDRICNGINDCMDGSDEEDCASKPCPYPDDRRCNTSQACIRADKWCNQKIDCVDASDEECFDTPCRYAGDFRCAYNGHCIRADEVCDGTEDCLDGSDEGMNYCPEVFTLGIHWERTLTKTINTHKCSEIYPSSLKLTDVITRECLRNRTWAPVNMSQCVMNSDSPIVMIAVVTLETNSTSLVKSRQDVIIEEMKLTEQPPVHMEIIQSVSNANVSVKITYEFNAFTGLIEYVNYDMNIAILGNISVANVPNFTIFQSTDVCQCPDSVSSSTMPTGANDKESIIIVSVCSGKPCQYSNSNFTYQCAAPFAGDGRMCGKDSDEDGYPDMALNCNDTHCIKDNCPTVHNPGQNLEACNGNGTQVNNSDQNLEGCNGTQVNNTDQNPEGCNCIQGHDDDNDDGLNTSTAIGITFVITLIFSILLTLFIVFIVYKMIKSKQSTARNENSATCPIITDTSFSRDSTTEYPENFNSAKDNARYQSNTGASFQMSPAYSGEKFESNDNAPAYKNLN